MKIREIKKNYIAIFVLILVSLVLLVFVVWPLCNDIKQGSQEMISAKNSIATLSAQRKETQDFAKKYQSYIANLQQIDNLFIDPNNPVSFIEFLENTAVDLQFVPKVLLQSSGSGQSASNQNHVIFQISVKGSFSNINELLKNLESGPYFIEIQNITVQNSDNLANKDIFKQYASGGYLSRQIQATLSMKAFIKK